MPRRSTRPGPARGRAAAPPADPFADLLARLGERVRAARRGHGRTVAQLAKDAGLSRRFLTDVELGKANVSLQGLLRIANALGLELAPLLAAGDDGGPTSRSRARAIELANRLPESALSDAVHHLERLHGSTAGVRRFALVGLRGAGKTTLGRKVAERLKLRFVELDQSVEHAAGMPLTDVFTLHGEAYYRQLERDALLQLLDDPRPTLVATGGGIVAAPDVYELLRRHFVTIWLVASPDDHWNRVVEQGDQRPMQGQPRAMARLREILSERAPLYGLAQHTVDTSELGLARSVERIEAIVKGER
jgi:XRE family aerobic/anaerobic benzoate catabolism transcriptional regulator